MLRYFGTTTSSSNQDTLLDYAPSGSIQDCIDLQARVEMDCKLGQQVKQIVVNLDTLTKIVDNSPGAGGLENGEDHIIEASATLPSAGPTSANGDAGTLKNAAADGDGALVLFETIDSVALEKLLQHPEVSQQDIKMLRRYQYTMTDAGTRKVSYKPSSHGIGRVYADMGLSLQLFPKRIRHTLSSKLYHDIDMVNAHPILMLHLCGENQWPAPMLQQYVDNREFILESIMHDFGVTRKQAKELMLRLMYGGALTKWMQDELIDTAELAATVSTGEAPVAGSTVSGTASVGSLGLFLEQFEDELMHLRDLICHRFPQVYCIAKVGRGALKAKKTCASLILQQREHDVMMAMANYFRRAGWTVGVYVFDGIMIEKRHDCPLTRTVLQECQQFILDMTQFDVKIEEKPMNNPYSLDYELPRWDRDYALRLLAGIPKDRLFNDVHGNSIKCCKTLAMASKGIGLNVNDFWNWNRIACSHVTRAQCEQAYRDSVAGKSISDAWQVLEVNSSAAVSNHNTRPIMDLECPYGIDDLIQARTIDRIRFIAPKVLALITGASHKMWYKKVISYSGDRRTVQFICMQDGLSSLADIYIVEGNSTMTHTSSDGQERAKTQTQLIRLDHVIQKKVLSEGDPARMTFIKFDFQPYTARFGRCETGIFNTFPGFPHQPIHDSSLDYAPIQPFLDGMKEIICNGDEDLFTCVCDTYTDILRHPERKSRICSVYYSPEQQIGKGLFGYLLGKTLVGNEMITQVANDTLVVGDFNAILENKLIVIIDESEARGSSYKFCGRLKNLISEPTNVINKKGIDPYTIKSCLRVWYCTNTLDALNIELFDARFLVAQCNPSRVGQADFFNQMVKIDEEYGWLLWNYFYHRQLSREDWKNHLPMTAIKRELMQRKFPTPIQFIMTCPRFWQGGAIADLSKTILPRVVKWHYDSLYRAYQTWAQSQQIDLKYTGKDWTVLVEPLKAVGIQPHMSNNGRVSIDARRSKGFSVEAQTLVDSVKLFLKKAGQEDFAEFEPPEVSLIMIDSDKDAFPL